MIAILFIIITAILPIDALAAPNTGGALGNIDLHAILYNLQQLLVPITQLILAISFLSGVALTFRGAAMLHTFGQLQNQMSKPHGITGPFVYIIIGSVLMYLPTTTTIFSNTIFGSNGFDSLFQFNNNNMITLKGGENNTDISVVNEPNYNKSASSELMSYANVGGGQEWSDLINTIVAYIQLVGLIAFVRGWFILSHSAESSGGQQGSFSKGLIHIIGGIMAINFVPFMHAISLLVFAT